MLANLELQLTQFNFDTGSIPDFFDSLVIPKVETAKPNFSNDLNILKRKANERSSLLQQMSNLKELSTQFNKKTSELSQYVSNDDPYQTFIQNKQAPEFRADEINEQFVKFMNARMSVMDEEESVSFQKYVAKTFQYFYETLFSEQFTHELGVVHYSKAPFEQDRLKPTVAYQLALSAFIGHLSQQGAGVNADRQLQAFEKFVEVFNERIDDQEYLDQEFEGELLEIEDVLLLEDNQHVRYQIMRVLFEIFCAQYEYRMEKAGERNGDGAVIILGEYCAIGEEQLPEEVAMVWY
ncbi:Conserved_hypothetical protein [Hexamita inflata]|uniref:Uncharacterized protein n=1 Tax=Hexamita inflata TaxID=28002 RepID=A0AA86UBU6_9EUKA|nr:Conserved hypothetical protein [Hexamita inflata]